MIDNDDRMEKLGQKYASTFKPKPTIEALQKKVEELDKGIKKAIELLGSGD